MSDSALHDETHFCSRRKCAHSRKHWSSRGPQQPLAEHSREQLLPSNATKENNGKHWTQLLYNNLHSYKCSLLKVNIYMNLYEFLSETGSVIIFPLTWSTLNECSIKWSQYNRRQKIWTKSHRILSRFCYYVRKSLAFDRLQVESNWGHRQSTAVYCWRQRCFHCWWTSEKQDLGSQDSCHRSRGKSTFLYRRRHQQ